MRGVVSGCLAAALVGALVSLAGPPAAAQARLGAADRKFVSACLEKERKAGRHGTACIGTLAERCIKGLQAQTSEGQRDCAIREAVYWSERMKAAWPRAERTMPKDRLADQRAAQESWPDLIRRSCAIFDGLDPGMVPGGSDMCALRYTAQRVLSLEHLIEATSEH